MDPRQRKDVLRNITYGLYVTTTAHGDAVAAAGVSWLSQCSFEPPLVMMALRKDGALSGLLRRSGRGVVHILGEGQAAIAKSFFGPTKHEAGTINGQPYRLEEGQPVLTALPWYFHFEVREWVDRGDHAIAVAAVTGANAPGDAAAPLALRDTSWSYSG